MTIDKPTESKVIDQMRLPLAILVVYVHTPRIEGNFVEWLWSDTIASMAVPIFFIISGYLYFWNVSSPDSPTEWYIQKTLSRLKSIGVPYIFWAILPITAYIFRKTIGMIIHHHGPEMLINGLSSFNFYHILWESGSGGPEQMSLWFLRNLLIIIFFTPLISIFLMKLKYSSLPILIVFSLIN